VNPQDRGSDAAVEGRSTAAVIADAEVLEEASGRLLPNGEPKRFSPGARSMLPDRRDQHRVEREQIIVVRPQS
jgi:hypothetical protein